MAFSQKQITVSSIWQMASLKAAGNTGEGFGLRVSGTFVNER